LGTVRVTSLLAVVTKPTSRVPSRTDMISVARGYACGGLVQQVLKLAINTNYSNANLLDTSYTLDFSNLTLETPPTKLFI
jgi:hypothetical protein